MGAVTGDNRRVDDLIIALSNLLGDRVTNSASVRDAHGRDESWHGTHPPGTPGISSP